MSCRHSDNWVRDKKYICFISVQKTIQVDKAREEQNTKDKGEGGREMEREGETRKERQRETTESKVSSKNWGSDKKREFIPRDDSCWLRTEWVEGGWEGCCWGWTTSHLWDTNKVVRQKYRMYKPITFPGNNGIIKMMMMMMMMMMMDDDGIRLLKGGNKKKNTPS